MLSEACFLQLGLDPREFAMIGNRLADEPVGYGDSCAALVRLVHALLRR